MFSISVCMIVKNEEIVLERILTCITSFADEIIIVDTGSTDNTIEIAKKFTDNIFTFKWCNDFSKARNYSFSKATKDYIMWLDADDYISNDNINKIINLKHSHKSIDVYMFKYIMGFIDGKPTFEFFRERILKRAKNFQWEGFVHEAITPQGNIQYTDIAIEHRKETINPPKRNLKLYNYALKQNIKFTPREQYYYSRELFFNRYYKSTIRNLKKYLRMHDKYTPNIKGAYLLLCNAFLEIKDNTSALKYGIKALELFTPDPEMCCIFAKTFEANKQLNQAIFWYNVALFAPLSNDGFIQTDYKDFIPYLELSRIYYRINKIDAKDYYLKAKKIHPSHYAIKYNAQFFS